MQPIDALAVVAGSPTFSRTAEQWIAILGQTLFGLAINRGIISGPSGPGQSRCYRCGSSGHPAPTFMNRTTGEYEVLCLEAGLTTVTAATVERHHVDRAVFLREVGTALGVLNPEQELRDLGDEIFLLGRAWYGKQPFALIAAMSLRTDREIEILHRRNRQGLGETTGLILCCNKITNPEPSDGFHSVCSFGTALSYSDSGLHPNVSEIRRRLGLPGRPAKEMQLAVDVRETLQTIVDGLGYIPKGDIARRLLAERRPDLAHVSRSTFFAAKSRVIAPPTRANSQVRD